MKDNNPKSALYVNYAGFQCLEQIMNDSIDLYLSTCGMQNCFPDHSFGPGTRDVFILHFICDGKGTYETDGKVYNLSKGDTFLIWPGQEVHYYADSKAPWTYIWVGFQGVKALTYLQAAGFDKEHLIGEFQDTSYVFTHIQQMLLSRQLTLSNELRRDSALLQVFAALIDNRHQSMKKEECYDYPYRIYAQQAVDYITSHYMENVRINDIANYIGIDRSYLAQIFKKSLQVSPQEYLLKYRMDQAKILLKSTDMKILNIAREVGYNDALTFSKVFKKERGLSPSEYRNLKYTINK